MLRGTNAIKMAGSVIGVATVLAVVGATILAVFWILTCTGNGDVFYESDRIIRRAVLNEGYQFALGGAIFGAILGVNIGAVFGARSIANNTTNKSSVQETINRTVLGNRIYRG